MAKWAWTCSAPKASICRANWAPAVLPGHQRLARNIHAHVFQRLGLARQPETGDHLFRA